MDSAIRNTLELALDLINSFDKVKPQRKGRAGDHVNDIKARIKFALADKVQKDIVKEVKSIELPKLVKVAGFDITIVTWTPREAMSAHRYGEFSSIEETIRLDATMSDIKMVGTLIHELTHAIYWAYNIEDEDKEERVCCTMATAWTQIYRDNPLILSFITNKLK